MSADAPTISSFSQFFPPRPRWSLTEIPDLSGRVIVVTGGNSGIGYETVLEVLRHGAKVYLATRSKERADKAIAKLKGQPGISGTVEFLPLDLADLRSIKAFAKEISAREQRIDVLFDNAGVMMYDNSRATKHGYEPHLGINALGTHYLTKLLIPLLQAAGAAHPDFPARVVVTSSYMHLMTIPKGFDPEDPTGEKVSLSVGMSRSIQCYSISKFCNILTARKFEREYGGQNISFTAVHPGAIRTNIMSDAQGLMSFMKDYVTRFIQITPAQGAYTQLYAAFAPGGLSGGAYFVPYGRICATLPAAYDTAVQDAFAKWADEQVARHPV